LKHRAKLDTSEKLGIAHKVIIDLEIQSDVAREYRVSNSRVSQIVKAAKKKPEMMREAVEEEDRRVQQIFQLHHFIKGLLAEDYVIVRANDVRELFNACYG
jgi:xylose isomerase